MRMSDWSSDVGSSDLVERGGYRVVEAGEARGVDVLDARELHLGERGAGGLLDRLEQVALARRDERDRVTGTTRATGAADAVHVGLGVGREDRKSTRLNSSH